MNLVPPKTLTLRGHEQSFSMVVVSRAFSVRNMTLMMITMCVCVYAYVVKTPHVPRQEAQRRDEPAISNGSLLGVSRDRRIEELESRSRANEGGSAVVSDGTNNLKSNVQAVEYFSLMNLEATSTL